MAGPVKQSGCHGQVFCKRQTSIVPGRVSSEEGWRVASVWPSGSCSVGRDERAWPWGREGAGLRLEERGDVLTPRKRFAS